LKSQRKDDYLMNIITLSSERIWL
jgi:hypothetical protein